MVQYPSVAEGAICHSNFCKEEDIEPHKNYSGSLNVRLTPDIHSRVAYLAKQAGVSINAFIRTAVEKQISAML